MSLISNLSINIPLNKSEDVVYHRNHRAEPEHFLKAINPFREDLVVAVECIFLVSWFVRRLLNKK